MDLTFPSSGFLSGSIFEQGLNQDLNESGSGLNWSGTLLSDAFLICGVQNVCSFEGFWQQKDATVPEPGSVALFGAALAGLSLIGWRRRTETPRGPRRPLRGRRPAVQVTSRDAR